MILFCPRCGNELAQRVKGEWFESATPCGACGLVLTEPPLVLAPDPDEEVEYALDGWEVPERAAATAALVEVDIPYRWEEGLVLVVPAVAEDEVDVLLEELEAPDELDADDDEAGGIGGDDSDDGEDADGGEEAQAAMADLFVVADRLQHAPDDLDVGASLLMLAAIVGESPPPYGIERPVWRRIQALAAATATAFDDGSDEETVAVEARALRDFLRDLV
jgi:hypothetical protein